MMFGVEICKDELWDRKGRLGVSLRLGSKGGRYESVELDNRGL